MAPGDWVANRYLLEDAKADVSVEVCLYCVLPV
jgi:hypothetical protein